MRGLPGISMRRLGEQLDNGAWAVRICYKALRALDLVWRRLRWPSAACWPCWTSATASTS